MSALIAFLSDYGLDDEFVGVCHAVMFSVASGARVIDLTHGIAPHDVRGGALALSRAVQYLPDETVVLAVVDPGVGTDRKPIAVRAGSYFFVGPDNGVLSPAVAIVGGATESVVLDSTEHRLPAAGGATFDGRDVFAPAAAFLASGTPLSTLGSPVSAAELVPLLLPLTGERPDGGLQSQVLWVDRFGNAQLNVDPDELEQLDLRPGSAVEVEFDDGNARDLRWLSAYGEADDDELVLIVDSYGLLSVARNRGRAVDVVPLGPGAPVTLRRPRPE